MRIFIIIMVFVAAIAVGSLAARGQEGVNSLGRQMVPVIEQSNGYLQVRVRGRIIVRIPRISRTQASRNNMGKITSRPIIYEEKKIGKCLIMDRFVGSRPGAGRKQNLELLTRDGVLVRAYLGDGCLSREFYAGAYMERPKDGRLCIERDLLHARTGAKCEIDKFRLLKEKKPKKKSKK